MTKSFDLILLRRLSRAELLLLSAIFLINYFFLSKQALMPPATLPSLCVIKILTERIYHRERNIFFEWNPFKLLATHHQLPWEKNKIAPLIENTCFSASYNPTKRSTIQETTLDRWVLLPNCVTPTDQNGLGGEYSYSFLSSEF